VPSTSKTTPCNLGILEVFAAPSFKGANRLGSFDDANIAKVLLGDF